MFPRGGGTKYEWGNACSSQGVTLSTKKLNRVLEHAWADLTVTVEAGCTIAELQRTLAQHGQRLAIDPFLSEQATVGGVLSANDTGALRLRYGGLRDLVIGTTIALADGTLAMSGGKVVKNVAGYDLSKLLTGAMGTLGVITQANFRLHPLPKNSKDITLNVRNSREAEQTLLKILDSTLTPVAMQVRASRQTVPQLDILFEGTCEGINAQMDSLKTMFPSIADALAGTWTRPDADAKISILPSQLSATLDAVVGDVVIQATGIGWIRQSEGLAQLRTLLEENGGSLVLLKRNGDLDAWGSAGDAVELMRAVKHQFDPNNILNPGRFVHGI